MNALQATTAAYFTNKLQALNEHWQLRRSHRTLVHEWRPSKAGTPKLLFLCYGNICRSPLAELLTRKESPKIQVCSAGFHPNEGRTVPAQMVTLAAEFGLDLAGHRSRRVSASDLHESDLVLVMDMSNYRALQAEFPWACNRATLLGFFNKDRGMAISDPYNRDIEEGRAIAFQIARAVRTLSQWIEARLDS